TIYLFCLRLERKNMSGTSAFHLARTVSKSPVPLIKFIVSAVLLNFLSPNEAALAQSLQPRVLHNFSGQAILMAPLVEGPDGCFYGTTVGGGSGGRGAVFKVTPDGAFTTLAVFTLYDGKSPNGLVLGSDGNFYGTTIQGGSSGFGTVFRMAPDGALTTPAHFNNATGAFPAGRLGPYRHSECYGTTVTGTNYNGTVFKVTKNGTLTTLANFPSAYESFPGGLTLGQDGSFYGTTYGGWEKAFRVTRRGKLTTLANLAGISYPYATGLTLCNDGNFYGTTFEGGCHRLGTVFRVTRHGAVTTLVNFNGRNGALPAGGLTLGSDGNFYGTTIYGGTFEGTVFKMTTDGKLTTLANFTDRLHGVRPYGGVTVGDNGSLYGTTITGGSGDSGIIFRVDLPPSILSQPASRFKGRGATATFIVAATGTKPFSYQWLKNGRKMVDGCNVRGANSNTLVLANVETSDGGNFA